VSRLSRPIRLVTFSTLYPNAAQPTHGVFVENRLRHLIASGEAVSRVVAPTAWFPFKSSRFGHYAKFAQVPAWEERHGLSIHHPRYPLIPKIGMNVAPFLLAMATLPAVRQAVKAGGGADIIDAHYLYPDGVAAMLIGRLLGIPTVLTARGTDVSLIPRYKTPRRMIQRAASNAAGVITVSAALKDGLTAMEVAADRITVLRNGVDLRLFRPLDREATRRRLGLDGPTLISVGHLIERKGHHLIIEAMGSLPGFTLLIAGEGPELYGAADALILASSREGWANVLLEAMACGTPVVATPIWGNPEVVARPEAGILMRERSPSGIAEGVKALFAALPPREATRDYASAFSWDATTEGQLALFRSIMARQPQL
jgi:teichuronic acid biosynthesis glycosyltransferase TuaC